jgi:NAD(P)-dependent dehydrogenase (short-subunit alcohol dehydrogenase family)
MENLSGKVAFITGGASGMGLGMATAFLRAGMKVMIADVRQDHLDEALPGLKAAGEAHGIRLDVTDRQAMAQAAAQTERVFGKVHVLCNNAGIAVAGPLKLATYDDWDWLLGVNLMGVINGVQAFLPCILRHGEGGHIVNTSSMAGILPHPNLGLYNTAKFAVVGYSESLRMELGEENIGVSAFCPGPVNTRIAECAKNRPAKFAASGYAETDKARAAMSDNPLFMSLYEAGEIVLEGIRRNQLYIFTHPEFAEGVRRRHDAILAAMPDRACNPELLKRLAPMNQSPIYSIAQRTGSGK